MPIRTIIPVAAFAVVILLTAVFVIVTSAEKDERTPGTAPPAQAGTLPPQDSAEGTALRALRYVQIGSEDFAVELYDPRIRDEFGNRLLERSLALRREALSGQSFALKLNDETSRGRLIAVHSSGPQGNADYSFVVARDDAKWLIVSDTFLRDALAEYVFLKEQRKAGVSNSSAERQAARIAERYKALLRG